MRSIGSKRIITDVTFFAVPNEKCASLPPMHQWRRSPMDAIVASMEVSPLSLNITTMMASWRFLLVFTATAAVVSHALQQPYDASSRRDFLAQTAATAATATTAPWLFNSPANAAAETSTLAPLKLPPVGLGCWAWGDSLFWGYDSKNDAQLQQVFDYATSSNYAPILLDTAELYGLGRSEQLLGQYSKSCPNDKVVMATKFAALPFRTTPDSVVKACQASLKRLGRPSIDLYQIHFPGAWANAAYWDGMAKCYDMGLIKGVGVSNYGVDAMLACQKALEARGVPLVSNQIQYNLLYKFPETNGLLQACQDKGIQVLAYSPMALGLLTGKYATPASLDNVVGPRKKLFSKTVGNPKFDALLQTMRQVAQAHSTTSTTQANLPQVAINWCRSKGTIPIPGARTLGQVQSNYAALEWELTSDEVQRLDEASAGLSYITPQDSPMSLYDKELQLQMFDS